MNELAYRQGQRDAFDKFGGLKSWFQNTSPLHAASSRFLGSAMSPTASPLHKQLALAHGKVISPIMNADKQLSQRIGLSAPNKVRVTAQEVGMGDLPPDVLARMKMGGASAAGPDGASSYSSSESPVATTHHRDSMQNVSQGFAANAAMGQTSNFTDPGGRNNPILQGGTPTGKFKSDTPGGLS